MADRGCKHIKELLEMVVLAAVKSREEVQEHNMMCFCEGRQPAGLRDNVQSNRGTKLAGHASESQAWM